MEKISSVGQRIKAERERLGLTQEAFGGGAGVTRLTQSKYESGASSPDINYLTKIEQLGADIGYVVSGKDAAYKDIEYSNLYARHAGEVVVALENQLTASGKALTPERKGLLVTNILRASRIGRPVDTEIIKDFLSLFP